MAPALVFEGQDVELVFEGPTGLELAVVSVNNVNVGGEGHGTTASINDHADVDQSGQTDGDIPEWQAGTLTTVDPLTRFEATGSIATHASDPVAHGSHTHTQVAPASTWNVPHNLNVSYPKVVAITDLGIEFQPDVDYVDVNNLTIINAVPVAGVAHVTP